jgi:SnoaL-like domain
VPTDTIESLSLRIALLEHQRDIAELTARYNDAWDTGDIDSWLSCFVAEGEFIQDGVPQTKGYDALRTMVSAMIPAGLVHLTMNHRITVSGSLAEQHARVILGRRSERRQPGTSTWQTSGWYSDRLALTDGGWKFVSRTFSPDASLAGLPAWW